MALEAQLEAGTLTVSATVKNNGAGHGMPTGEPMRSVLVLVRATCEGEPIAATGGDAVPDFGGYLDRKQAGTDWTSWPGAQQGDVIRVYNYVRLVRDVDIVTPISAQASPLKGTVSVIRRGKSVQLGGLTSVAVTVQFVSVQGRMMHQQKLSAGTASVGIPSGLSAGVYMMQVQSSLGNLTHSFVVR